MFILRKLTGENLEMNFSLGDQYNIIYKEYHPEEFMKTIEVVGWDVNDPEYYIDISVTPKP